MIKILTTYFLNWIILVLKCQLPQTFTSENEQKQNNIWSFFSWNWSNYPDSLEFHMLTIFLVASVYMAENKLITVHRFLLSNGKQIPTRNIYFLFLYNLHIVIWHSALKSEKRQKCNGYQSINYSSQIFDFLNNLVMCSKIWKKTKVNVMAVKKLITVHRFLIFIQFA